ncbi:hypothetical protein UlMin_012781 [Ulmus minor]
MDYHRYNSQQETGLDIELEEAEENTKKREQSVSREFKQRSRKYARNLKQYKLAMEFEAHLSSYNHNLGIGLQRFKEMREMHGMSSRDDRPKWEQQREEREMAKFAQIAYAHKQQEESGSAPALTKTKSSSILADKEQRKALKFGFSSKGGTSKISFDGAAKKPKPKVPVASIFSNDSDEEK